MSRKSTLSSKPKPKQAYSCGIVAYTRNVSKRANPYTRPQQEFYQWLAGWNLAKKLGAM